VPWSVVIPEAERDPMLVEKLRAELPGILAWAVRGCLAWQRDGLRAPDAVREATAAYRAENDALGEFFRLHTVFEPDAKIARKDLREAYESFCRENGSEPFGAKRFAGRLREKGVKESGVRRGASIVNGWKGVRMATDAERAAAVAWSERRYVGTCRQQDPDYQLNNSLDHINRESVPTSTNVPTDESRGIFDDLLDGAS
jgi:phage/plasmid-associated DNA primase